MVCPAELVPRQGVPMRIGKRTVYAARARPAEPHIANQVLPPHANACPQSRIS